MCIDWIELFVTIVLISPHLKIHVCWKDVLHQPVDIILTFQNNYILHLAKIYHRLHYRTQAAPDRFCIAHCSLFMPFIHCRHNSTVYRVSKQHKHHSTYPSMYHCYEPGHFATFSPKFHLNTTFTHKTASHKRSSLTWRSSPCWCTEIFLCISDINILDFGIWWRRDWGSRLSPYYHLKGHIYTL